MKFTAVFEKVPEGYIAFVEELPGANTLAEEMMKGKKVIRENVPLQAA